VQEPSTIRWNHAVTEKKECICLTSKSHTFPIGLRSGDAAGKNGILLLNCSETKKAYSFSINNLIPQTTNKITKNLVVANVVRQLLRLCLATHFLPTILFLSIFF
jgi:hypothetical protein